MVVVSNESYSNLHVVSEKIKKGVACRLRGGGSDTGFQSANVLAPTPAVVLCVAQRRVTIGVSLYVPSKTFLIGGSGPSSVGKLAYTIIGITIDPCFRGNHGGVDRPSGYYVGAIKKNITR